MSSIELKNDLIFYYGNTAGYLEKDTATVDSMFQNCEFEKWIEQRKLTAKWKEGVFQRLARGEKTIASSESHIPLKDCRIWQIKSDIDPSYKFIGYKELKENFGEPHKDNYIIVYEGEIETNDLEAIYVKFNSNHPLGFTGHSLSMSDVVELYDSKGSKFYYVDRFGFKEIDFNSEKQEQNQEINMSI